MSQVSKHEKYDARQGVAKAVDNCERGIARRRAITERAGGIARSGRATSSDSTFAHVRHVAKTFDAAVVRVKRRFPDVGQRLTPARSTFAQHVPQAFQIKLAGCIVFEVLDWSLV